MSEGRVKMKQKEINAWVEQKVREDRFGSFLLEQGVSGLFLWLIVAMIFSGVIMILGEGEVMQIFVGSVIISFFSLWVVKLIYDLCHDFQGGVLP
jgi:hypothetical protein